MSPIAREVCDLSHRRCVMGVYSHSGKYTPGKRICCASSDAQYGGWLERGTGNFPLDSHSTGLKREFLLTILDRHSFLVQRTAIAGMANIHIRRRQQAHLDARFDWVS